MKRARKTRVLIVKNAFKDTPYENVVLVKFSCDVLTYE